VKVVVNNFDVEISHNVVHIRDPDKKLGEKGAVTILKYLKAEGFLMYDEVYVQVISEDEDD
tara:strand:+ start:2494 stop:2676 length:183 start_codon:yes stop_codon:yes gene_type:complete